MRPVQKVLMTISWGLMVVLMVCLLSASLRRPRPAVIADAPNFDLIDQDHQPVTLKSMNGKAWIADLVFTHCAGPCPTMTLKMANLEKAITSPGVRFVSFSVDPERDTPAVLKEYAKKFNADESRWKFLTGSSDEIQKTARGLLVTALAAEGDNPIIHDERFILIDADGKICGYYHSKDPIRRWTSSSTTPRHSGPTRYGNA